MSLMREPLCVNCGLPQNVRVADDDLPAFRTTKRALLDRAKSYGRDAAQLKAMGDTTNAAVYRAIADELRACANKDGAHDDF